MRKALTLLVAFAFMGSMATAQPVPGGGGSFIIEDGFSTQSTDTWAGSGAGDKEAIGYFRDGDLSDTVGRYEHWPKAASGASARADGAGNLLLEMFVAPWQAYIDARYNSVTTDGSHSHTVISSLTMPGSGGMFVGFSNPPGTFNKGIKCVGGSIYWAHDDDGSGDIWNASPTAQDLDTGGTYTAGEQFSIMYSIATDGTVSVWQHAGSQESSSSAGWVDITPAGAAYTHDTVSLSLHTVEASTTLETDLCVVDYLAWVEDATDIGPPAPVNAGGGSFIIQDDFVTQSTDTWGGSGSGVKEAIGYVRGGELGDDLGRWEHWPKAASGASARADGAGNLVMEMFVAPWQSYIDARNNSVTTDGSHSNTVIASLTMPDSGGMFVGFSNPPGTFNKGIKVVGGSIYWAHDDDGSGDIWNASPTAQDLDTGGTYTAGEQFSVMFSISVAGDVEVWQHGGVSKETNGPGWVDITPAGATYTHDTVSLSLHTIEAATTLETDLCVVDYLAWVEDANMIPVELSDFTLE
jgi:hypothetical protein